MRKAVLHNFPLPDKPEFEKLIISVYEQKPVAEISRLNRIEERLARKLLMNRHSRSANKIPWWIVLIIASSFASAAWWAGKIYNNVVTKEDGRVYDKQSTLMQKNEIPVKPDIHQGKQTTEQEDQTRQKKSPVIIRQEY